MYLVVETLEVKIGWYNDISENSIELFRDSSIVEEMLDMIYENGSTFEFCEGKMTSLIICRISGLWNILGSFEGRLERYLRGDLRSL